MTHPFEVAVALEGGIARRNLDGVLELVPGAAEFLVAASEAGGRVWLVSPAAAPSVDAVPGDQEDWVLTGRVPADAEVAWVAQAALRDQLRALGVWDLVRVWEAPGAPPATAVVDARAALPGDLRQLALELGLLVS